MKTKFSIIVPVYNAEKYLTDCLDSILAQTYNEWEVFCVDDGSTDLSVEILESYAEKDARINVYRKTNGGAGSARNYALSKISSDVWLSFVDADDYISPTMYEDVALALENSTVNYIKLSCNNTNERYAEQKGSGEHKWEIITKEQYFQRGNVGGNICSLMVKASVIRNNSLSFDERLAILEDQLFSIQCALCSESIMLYYKRNYFYYSVPDSLTNIRKDRGGDIINCINSMLGFVDRGKYDACIVDYFYKKWLPVKIALYIECKFKILHGMTEISMLNPKYYDKTYLPFKSKIKYHFLQCVTIIDKIMTFFRKQHEY